MFLRCNNLARRLHLVLDMGRGATSRVRSEGSTTMMKLNQTGNVNVLEEAQLGQVVGGHHGGGHRRRYNYNYCYDRRQYNDCYDYGYESKGSDCSYDYDYDRDDCYDYDNDYCNRRYS